MELRDLTANAFDLAVIGGGINGCGIARDAAGRGARVVLLEQDDLAGGTSSASTKLIHGGLRYLEHGEFGLVREALRERLTLWHMAPHIIRPLRFVLPHQAAMRPRWLLRTGLWIYDQLGGRGQLPSARSVDLSGHTAGAALLAHHGRGWEYSDAWVDDARLVVLNARDAADRGACILPRHRVTSARRTEDGWRIDADAGCGTTVTLSARAIVNAAGPAVLDLLSVAGAKPRHQVRLVRGSHIVVPRLFDHDLAYLFQMPDRRIVFAIPYEDDFTLVGTTDEEHVSGLRGVMPSPAELDYLCAAANAHFRHQITTADIVWSFAGVRPLIDDGIGKPEAASRGYRLQLDAGDGAAPLLSIFGGKITTYRKLAERAVTMLAPHLPVLRGPPWTGRAALPGGKFPANDRASIVARLRSDFPFLDQRMAARLAAAYGTCAWTWLGDATEFTSLGRHFGAGLTAAEVDYCAEHEWAQTADDVLWRRTKLGLRMTVAQRVGLEQYLSDRSAA